MPPKLGKILSLMNPQTGFWVEHEIFGLHAKSYFFGRNCSPHWYFFEKLVFQGRSMRKREKKDGRRRKKK